MITSTFHTESPSLLWWDDDPKEPTVEKIKAAVMAYKRKFGFYPTSCYVNMDLRDMPPIVEFGRSHKVKITVSGRPFMMPCYYQVQGE